MTCTLKSQTMALMKTARQHLLAINDLVCKSSCKVKKAL